MLICNGKWWRVHVQSRARRGVDDDGNVEEGIKERGREVDINNRE